MVRNTFIIILMGITLVACEEKNRFDNIDTSKIDVKIEVQRFDQDLFKINSDSIETELPALRNDYGRFVDMFCEGIIRIGKSTSPQYNQLLKYFLTDTMVRNAQRKVQSAYPDLDELNSTLTDAFKRYNYHFPTRTIPRVVSYVSGYNLSVAVDDSIAAVGLDRYLGSRTPQYDMLGIPKYMSNKMTREKLPSDIIRAWLYGEFAFNDSIDNLLSNMIYEGELIYITKHLLPSEPEYLIHGFTPKQMKWCKANEEDMWTYLIENKMLFTTNTLDINKFVNDAPFTSGFPQESPGRAAVWIGYRIIESLMERNPTMSLEELMSIKDYQQVLNMARYKP
ncbi:MAG: hypothetical protein AB7S48_04850 [Bacteroidales bacterium]